MVYATLEESILALNSAEGAFRSTLDDFQDRLTQGYVKEMKGDELAKVNEAFNSIETILNQLDQSRNRFKNLKLDFKRATSY